MKHKPVGRPRKYNFPHPTVKESVNKKEYDYQFHVKLREYLKAQERKT